MLIIYLTLLCTGLYFAVKMLFPEMKKPSASAINLDNNSTDFSHLNELDNRIEKLENLLTEKNKNLSLLLSEVKIYQIQVRDHSKVRGLMEEEIYRLREQNRIFRSELGIPADGQKENSISK